MKNENKLKGRDLINIGVFGAIYFVILFAVAMLGMIPIFLPLLSLPFYLMMYQLKHTLYASFEYVFILFTLSMC